MNRDELLTKLAMELAKWPKLRSYGRISFDPPPVKIWGIHNGAWECFAKGDARPISKDDYLAERARLINKPSWGGAPEWATHRAQDGDTGRWYWYECEPEPERDENKWTPRDGSEYLAIASDGTIPNGHNWRDTLEARPQEQSAESRLHDDTLARDAKSVSAADFLHAGLKHMEDRASTYDKPEGERSMAATVSAFAAITGIQMTESDGWLFMCLLKIVRSRQGAYRADNFEDLAAYAGLAGEAATRERG